MFIPVAIITSQPLRHILMRVEQRRAAANCASGASQHKLAVRS